MDESGHVDFYINGAENQPECSIITFPYDIFNLISRLSYDVIPCSHGRAVSLFNDALLPSRCQSVGYQCASIDAFNEVKAINQIIDDSWHSLILHRVIAHPVVKTTLDARYSECELNLTPVDHCLVSDSSSTRPVELHSVVIKSLYMQLDIFTLLSKCGLI